jgi:hypothetical protein
MIVYQNSLITLNYTPETDVLLVEWPSFEPYAILEVMQTLQKLIEVINNYNVRNLLIDASKANINMTGEDYSAIFVELITDLENTHIQKLARVMTPDPLREEKVYTMRQQRIIPYDFRDFRTKEEALNWLVN